MEPLGYVSLRFRRLSADSRMDMDGFLMKYGCAGSTEAKRCANAPVMLITSNISEGAACPDHLVQVLQSTIDDVLRSENGETGSGFLRKPKPGPAIDLSHEHIEATANVIWQNRLDNRFDIVVFAAVQPYRGVLVIRDGAKELRREPVLVSYNAPFGPDAADVDDWMERGISIVDEAKAPDELLSEALTRVEKDRKARLKMLRKTTNAAHAYLLALALYRAPERALDWLISPNAALQRKAPFEIVDQEGGIELIKHVLENVAKTVYPLS